MKNKLGILLTLLLTLVSITILAAGGGTAEDPLVSVSYLETVFTRPYEQKLNDVTFDMYWDAVEDFEEAFLLALDDMQLKKDKSTAIAQRLYQDWLNEPTRLTADGPVTVTLYKGDQVLGVTGSRFILLSGTAAAVNPTGTELLDLHLGEVVPNGTALSTNRYYMTSVTGGHGAVITSDTAEMRIFSGGYVQANYKVKYTDRADTLKAMGLFLGSESGYELDRTPTRLEALIMLVRMLGEEKAAAAYTGANPFTDLTGWQGGWAYIGYGAAKGYTSGTTATTFSQDETAGLDTYLTFMLRALGYSDAKGDFVWNTTSRTLAQQIGLITKEQLNDAVSNGFFRDHVVAISYNALSTKLKDGSMTLGQKLVKAGAITSAQLSLLQ